MELRPKSSLLNLIWMIFIACLVIVPVAIAADEDEDGAPVFVASDPVPNNMLQTGSLSKQIPVKVPPGRNAMAPKISLQYSSSNKENGWIGMGWSMNIDFIQRSAKRGVDYSANDFVFGGEELVPVSVDASTGSGEYCLKIESDFTKFYYNPGSGWTALLKDGTKHFFGLMSSSRADNTHGVFRWYLCKAEDSNGNYTVYDYEKDAQYGAVYPLKISYTYNDATEAYNRVEFIREGRTDLIPSYTTHTAVITAERLKYIKTYANDQLANQYVFNYDYGENSGRSRLIEVQLFGTDGTTALPAIVFEYTQGGNGTVGNQNNTSLKGKNLKSKAFGDFDGDGFNDVVLSGVSWQDDSDGMWVLFSKGDGTFADPVHIFDYGSGWYTLYPLAGDVNGDGKCDIVLIWIDWDETEEYWEVRPRYKVFLAQEGRTFETLSTQFFTMQGTPIVRDLDGCGNIFLGDINGDGLSDLLYSDISSYYYHAYCTYISDGNGTFEEHYYNLGTHYYGKEVAFTDVTGDGRSDLVKLHGNNNQFSITTVRVYPGDVDGRLGDPKDTPVVDWEVPSICGNSQSSCYSHYYSNIADINGDGLNDIVHYRNNSNQVDIYFAKGDGFFDEPYPSTLSGTHLPSQISGDVNGDGYDDLLSYSSYHHPNTIYVHQSKGNGDFRESIVSSVSAS